MNKTYLAIIALSISGVFAAMYLPPRLMYAVLFSVICALLYAVILELLRGAADYARIRKLHRKMAAKRHLN